MRTLVVFDSMYGNTQLVAAAVAEGLSPFGPVDLVAVPDAPHPIPDGVDLMVVGGPTHGHGLSNATSRRVTPEQAAQGARASRIGLREWLTRLGPGDTPVATFDTRFDKPTWLTGSAARAAARRLKAKGHPVIAPPESFFVAHTTGPLTDEQVDRARLWGRALGALSQAATST
jgi:hypothetical protein